MWAVPALDINGVAISNPTPVKFGVMQDLTISFEFSAKELFSRFQIPIAVARSAGKITWSAKFAQVNALLFHSIFFGNTGQPTAGALTIADDEIQTIPGTPYGLNITNNTTYIRDLGVLYQTTGIPLQVVKVAPGTGQYVATPGTAGDFQASTAVVQGQFIKPLSGNAGGYFFMALAAGTTPGSAPVWTQTVGATVSSTPNWLNIGTLGGYLFAAGDTGLKVLINYTYQPAFGYQTTFTSQQLGSAPQFGVVARGIFTGAPMTIRLDNCIAAKLTVPRKVDDWMILQLDGEAFVGAQGTGNAGFISVNELL